MELYEIEMAYTQEIYTSIGLVEDVNRFVSTDASKGLMNSVLAAESSKKKKLTQSF